MGGTGFSQLLSSSTIPSSTRRFTAFVRHASTSLWYWFRSSFRARSLSAPKKAATARSPMSRASASAFSASHHASIFWL